MTVGRVEATTNTDAVQARVSVTSANGYIAAEEYTVDIPESTNSGALALPAEQLDLSSVGDTVTATLLPSDSDAYHVGDQATLERTIAGPPKPIVSVESAAVCEGEPTHVCITFRRTHTEGGAFGFAYQADATSLGPTLATYINTTGLTLDSLWRARSIAATFGAGEMEHTAKLPRALNGVGPGITLTFRANPSCLDCRGLGDDPRYGKGASASFTLTDYQPTFNLGDLYATSGEVVAVVRRNLASSNPAAAPVRVDVTSANGYVPAGRQTVALAEGVAEGRLVLSRNPLADRSLGDTITVTIVNDDNPETEDVDESTYRVPSSEGESTKTLTILPSVQTVSVASVAPCEDDATRLCLGFSRTGGDASASLAATYFVSGTALGSHLAPGGFTAIDAGPDGPWRGTVTFDPEAPSAEVSHARVLNGVGPGVALTVGLQLLAGPDANKDYETGPPVPYTLIDYLPAFEIESVAESGNAVAVTLHRAGSNRAEATVELSVSPGDSTPSGLFRAGGTGQREVVLIPRSLLGSVGTAGGTVTVTLVEDAAYTVHDSNGPANGGASMSAEIGPPVPTVRIGQGSYTDPNAEFTVTRDPAGADPLPVTVSLVGPDGFLSGGADERTVTIPADEAEAVLRVAPASQLYTEGRLLATIVPAPTEGEGEDEDESYQIAAGGRLRGRAGAAHVPARVRIGQRRA